MKYVKKQYHIMLSPIKLYRGLMPRCCCDWDGPVCETQEEYDLIVNYHYEAVKYYR